MEDAMITFTHKISDKNGLHAQNALCLMRTAMDYDCRISVSCRQKTADARQVLALMGLAARCGEELTFCLEGTQERQAAEHMKALAKELL